MLSKRASGCGEGSHMTRGSQRQEESVSSVTDSLPAGWNGEVAE